MATPARRVRLSMLLALSPLLVPILFCLPVLAALTLAAFPVFVVLAICHALKARRLRAQINASRRWHPQPEPRHTGDYHYVVMPDGTVKKAGWL